METTPISKPTSEQIGADKLAQAVEAVLNDARENVMHYDRMQVRRVLLGDLQAALKTYRHYQSFEDGLSCLLDEARSELIAFCAPWAANYARDHGLPDGHLFATHYDILAKAGARMDSFIRHEEAWRHPGS